MSGVVIRLYNNAKGDLASCMSGHILVDFFDLAKSLKECFRVVVVVVVGDLKEKNNITKGKEK